MDPSFIDHPALGRLEVLDDTDPSLLTVRNEAGNTLKIGKRAVSWGMPEPGPQAQQPSRRDAMETKVIEFAVERETKNTVRYEEQTSGQPPAVGTLYVQKWALGSPPPPKLRITIEPA